MAIPETTRAAYITELGPAERIQIGALPIPPLGPTDVLVRTEALAVNPVDALIRSGAYPTPIPMPFIVGRDLVGTVVASGAGAFGFSEGDRVWTNSLGHEGRQGAFAEYAIVSAERLYHLPTNVEPEQAVGVFHPAATAYLALFRHARVRPGDTVLIGGAAGNVGSCAVQLAVEAGARVIATASERDLDWCRKLGASVVLDYHSPDLAEAVRDAAPDGVSLFWNTSGEHDFDLAVSLLAEGGTIIVTAGFNARAALPVGPMYLRGARIVGFVISRAGVEELAEAAKAMNRLLARDALRVRIAATLPLDETAEAHRMIEGNAPRPAPGRIIVLP